MGRWGREGGEASMGAGDLKMVERRARIWPADQESSAPFRLWHKETREGRVGWQVRSPILILPSPPYFKTHGRFRTDRTTSFTHALHPHMVAIRVLLSFSVTHGLQQHFSFFFLVLSKSFVLKFFPYKVYLQTVQKKKFLSNIFILLKF